jgi:hypothetical protein
MTFENNISEYHQNNIVIVKMPFKQHNKHSFLNNDYERFRIHTLNSNLNNSYLTSYGQNIQLWTFWTLLF